MPWHNLRLKALIDRASTAWYARYMTCERGHRCARCFHLNYQRAVQSYQKRCDELLNRSPIDALGNIIVHPSRVQSLLKQRANLSKAYRKWQRKKHQEQV